MTNDDLRALAKDQLDRYHRHDPATPEVKMAQAVLDLLSALEVAERELDKWRERAKAYSDALVFAGPTKPYALRGVDEPVEMPEPETIAKILDDRKAAERRADEAGSVLDVAMGGLRRAHARLVCGRAGNLEGEVDEALSILEVTLRTLGEEPGEESEGMSEYR